MQVIALNTLGVLYVVTDGSVEVSSIKDLEGQTVYAPAQNPSFLFQALCDANGVKVTVDNSFAQPAELNTAVTAGKVAIAVLPEPLLTVACSQNKDLKVVLDLTEEWDKVFTPGSLVQGCAVVRTAFAEEHPDAVAAFLKDYEASVQLLTDDVKTAAQCIEEMSRRPQRASRMPASSRRPPSPKKRSPAATSASSPGKRWRRSLPPSMTS